MRTGPMGHCRAVEGLGGIVEPARLAKAHGTFNLVSGLWPLLSRRTFEKVTGPKADWWLVQTVAGLMVTNGLTQLLADDSPGALRLAGTLGRGTALTLGIIDVVHPARGKISKVYLVDAAAEAAWLMLWTAAGRVSER